MRIRDIQFNKDKLFFTSDTHFFHKNIIKYVNRPFETVEEMNETIVTRWNETIPKDADVFHMGDVSLTAGSKELSDILYSLNGRKHLIIGNHEKDVLKRSHIRSIFSGIYDIAEIYVPDKEITYGEQHIVMCHYPMLTWNASHRGSWQLFGHVHGGLSNKGVINHKATQIDVGVDCHDLYPVSYQTVKELITKQVLDGN